MFTELHADTRVTCTPLPAFDTMLPFPTAGGVALLDDGARQWLLGAPYSSTGHSTLTLIALPGGEVVSTFPLHDQGAQIVAAPNGRAYLGTADGRMLAFDRAAGALEEVGRCAAPITAGVYSAGQCVFACANGAIVLFDPARRTVTALEEATCDEAMQAMLAMDDGRVIALQAGALVLIDPAARTLTRRPLPDVPSTWCAMALPTGELLLGSQRDGRCYRLSDQTLDAMPALPDGDAFFSLQRVTDAVLASGRFTGSLYLLTPEGWRLLGTPMPHDPLHIVPLPDGRIAGITYQGRLVQSQPGWQMYALARLPNRAPHGLHLRALGLGADRQLYCSFARNMRVGRWDIEEETLAAQYVVIPSPGEVNVFGIAGERLYMGFGEPCGVMCFYPESPYRLLENPKYIGMAGAGQVAPVGAMISMLGRLYFATRGADGDGALVSIEPFVDRLTTYHGIVPGQQPTGVVAERMNHLLVVSARSTGADPARVACWATDTAETKALATPFADAPLTHVWAAEGGRAFVTDGGDRLAIICALTGDVLETGRFPLGAITALVATPHGELYGLAGGWLFHFDPIAGHIQRLCEATGEHLTVVRRDRLVYTCTGRLYNVQIW